MNKLEHIKDFQSILKHYKISPHSKQILDNTELIALIAPSSSGRNTIIRELVKTGDYYFIVSDTTRRPRVNDGVLEKNGVEYWFREEKDFLADLKDGKFLEAEIIHNQQVSGISIRELEKASEGHKIAITDMDIGGVHNVVQAKPDTLAIMVLPPDFAEWQRRMSNRGHMHPNEHTRRLKTAVTIFKEALRHDYFVFVVNQNFHQTTALMDTLAKKGTNGLENQDDGRKLVKQLLKETEAQLKAKNG